MKLLQIESTPLKRAVHPTAKGYWILTEDASAVFTFDKYRVILRLRKGWVSDLRSGDRRIDKFIPKWSNTDSTFNWGIALHDASYSGWVVRCLADDMLLAVWESNTSVKSDTIAKIGYGTVRTLGWIGYYEIWQPLPGVYKYNRGKEYIAIYKRNT